MFGHLHISCFYVVRETKVLTAIYVLLRAHWPLHIAASYVPSGNQYHIDNTITYIRRISTAYRTIGSFHKHSLSRTFVVFSIVVFKHHLLTVPSKLSTNRFDSFQVQDGHVFFDVFSFPPMTLSIAKGSEFVFVMASSHIFGRLMAIKWVL